MSQSSSTERSLKLRLQMKSKRPKFRRQESWRYKRVSPSWRRPDGVDSKMRRKIKGWPKSAEVGYRGPRKARSLHPSGYEEVLVRNVDDLSKVDPETQAARIAHTVGMRKRAEISVRAGERRIYIVNPLPKEKPEEAEEAEEKGESEVTKEEEEGREAEKMAEVEPEAKAEQKAGEESSTEEDES